MPNIWNPDKNSQPCAGHHQESQSNQTAVPAPSPAQSVSYYPEVAGAELKSWGRRGFRAQNASVGFTAQQSTSVLG